MFMELVILAAGMGSRFGGLKQIEPMDEYGNFILDYSIYDAIEAGFDSVVFVIKEELYNDFRKRAKQEKTDVTEDVVFEMELIKSIEVNIDYILGLVKKYHDSNMEDKEILVTIQKTIMASPDLRNKKDLIMAFIESLDQDSNVYADFESFMNSKKKEELDKIIGEENLNKEKTYNFIQRSFEQGKVETNGTEVS